MPLYQRLNGSQPTERFRFGLNASYFFWSIGDRHESQVVSTTALLAMLLVPATALAELRRVDIKTLGMD